MQKKFVILMVCISLMSHPCITARFNQSFFDHNDSYLGESPRAQDCSISGGAWAIIGLIVGATLCFTIIKKLQSHQEECILKTLLRKAHQTKNFVTYLRTLYHHELNKSEQELTDYYKARCDKMHHKPSQATIEQLKHDIEELEASLIYLYGQEHTETQELLAQLHTLYTLYMTLFVEQEPDSIYTTKGFSYESF